MENKELTRAHVEALIAADDTPSGDNTSNVSNNTLTETQWETLEYILTHEVKNDFMYRAQSKHGGRHVYSMEEAIYIANEVISDTIWELTVGQCPLDKKGYIEKLRAEAMLTWEIENNDKNK